MENYLKKRLALIKARANRLKNIHFSDPTDLETGREGNTEQETERERIRTPMKKASFIELNPAYAEALEFGYGRGILGEVPPHPTLEEVFQGEGRSVAGSRFFLIRLEGSAIDERAEEESARFRGAGRFSIQKNRIFPNKGRAGPDPLGNRRDRLCFFDIETTGLSPSTYAFLCGMMFLEGDNFVVEQAFARDYDEEEGALRYVRERFAAFETVVTYNGKTFDIPFIRARMAVNRIDFNETFTHVDLLGPARRVYRGVLENCRLGTVERHIRGEDREGDIPGSQIPAAYHAFVRTGNTELIERILYHNRMDILFMAILCNRFWPGGSIE